MNLQDNRLFDLLPHRPPMLLLDKIVNVTDQCSESEVIITTESAFYSAHQGVPAWVSLEYMGQTAALIAGLQLEKGVVEPHVGFLLGTRKFRASVSGFKLNSVLKVVCEELAVVGDSLATFDCHVEDKANSKLLASTKLSVFRKPMDSAS